MELPIESGLPLFLIIPLEELPVIVQLMTLHVSLEKSFSPSPLPARVELINFKFPPFSRPNTLSKIAEFAMVKLLLAPLKSRYRPYS